MNSKRNLVKVCINCKEIIVNPKLNKNENEICGKCKELVVRYAREHLRKVEL